MAAPYGHTVWRMVARHVSEPELSRTQLRWEQDCLMAFDVVVVPKAETHTHTHPPGLTMLEIVARTTHLQAQGDRCRDAEPQRESQS